MKKLLRIVSIVLTICCAFPVTTFAVDDNHIEKPVGIIIETTNEDLTRGNTIRTTLASTGIVDLSKGNSIFTVGRLNTKATYTTNTYSITRSTLKIGLQSIGGASNHIKVTLYKSNGVSVAVTTLSLPWSTPTGSAVTTYATFTNLDTTSDYYAIIENIDTTQSGTILGVAKQS